MKTRDRLIAATQELPDREDFTGTVAARLLRGCDVESALAMYEVTSPPAQVPATGAARPIRRGASVPQDEARPALERGHRKRPATAGAAVSCWVGGVVVEGAVRGFGGSGWLSRVSPVV